MALLETDAHARMLATGKDESHIMRHPHAHKPA